MPTRVINLLLFLIAKTTHSKLAQQVEYLKAENEVLRARLLKQIRTTKKERQRLIRAGKPLGVALKQLMTIVSYTTFLSWQRNTAKKLGKCAENGRPPTSETTHDLVLRLARENDWGYGRIQGELKSLGIKLSKTTIKNILREDGLEPTPKAPRGNWAAFIKRHAETLWACDFISSRTLTKIGFKDCYVLFFIHIHIQSRRIYASGVATCLNSDWMAQQARDLCIPFKEKSSIPVKFLHDRDGKFTPQFCRILEERGYTPIKLPTQSPNLNAFAERWVRSIRNECLNHFMIFGEGHMRHLVAKNVRYYNEPRPYQGIGNRRIGAVSDPPQIMHAGKLECRSWLGGLLKNYSRQAA